MWGRGVQPPQLQDMESMVKEFERKCEEYNIHPSFIRPMPTVLGRLNKEDDDRDNLSHYHHKEDK